MTPGDSMAVRGGLADAYRAARINQMVGMYSPDAVIDVRLRGWTKLDQGPARKVSRSDWEYRFIEMPGARIGRFCRWTVRPWWSPTKRTAGLLRHC